MDEQLQPDTVHNDYILPIEKEMPDVIDSSGFYINDKEKRWELWFINKTQQKSLIGFSNFSCGQKIKEYWKYEFYQRYSGLRNDQDGFHC